MSHRRTQRNLNIHAAVCRGESGPALAKRYGLHRSRIHAIWRAVELDISTAKHYAVASCERESPLADPSVTPGASGSTTEGSPLPS